MYLHDENIVSSCQLIGHSEWHVWQISIQNILHDMAIIHQPSPGKLSCCTAVSSTHHNLCVNYELQIQLQIFFSLLCIFLKNWPIPYQLINAPWWMSGISITACLKIMTLKSPGDRKKVHKCDNNTYIMHLFLHDEDKQQLTEMI